MKTKTKFFPIITLQLLMPFLGFSQVKSFKPFEAPQPQDIFETIRGVISPDGLQFVFGSYQTGDHSLRFKLFDIKTKKNSTITKSAGFRRNVSWSPDGKNIVYADIMKGREGLWVLDLVTLTEKQIYKAINESVATPEWRENNKIVFQINRKSNTDFVAVEMDKLDTQTQITNLPFGSKNASLSPDGLRITYSVSSNGKQVLYVKNLENGNTKQLTESLFILPERPIWSKDNKNIYFTASKNDDSCFNLWQYNLDSLSLVAINNSDGDVMRISQLSNGKLAYTSFNPILSVGVMPISGGEPKNVLPISDHDALMPSWSADGNEIYYMQGKWLQTQMIMTNNLKWDIYKSQLDLNTFQASDSQAVITESGEDYGPCISPNNKWIAFHGHRNNTDDIYIKSNTVKSDSIVTISTGGSETGDPAWSADGTQLVFTSTIAEEWNRPFIVKINDQTGMPVGKPEKVNLEDFKGHAYSSRFSPDGKLLAFCGRTIDNLMGIFVVSVSGGKPEPIIKYNSGETYGFAEWSKDGKYLYYTTNENNKNYVIKKMSIASRKTSTISSGNSSAIHPRLSPDGKHMAVTLYNPDVKIWIEK